MSDADRRRYVRIPSIIPVAYQLTDDKGTPFDNEVRTGFTHDLSEGGLCLQLLGLPEGLSKKASDDAGTRITVDMALPQRRLRLQCRVAWTKAAGEGDEGKGEHCLGVEFDGVSPEDRAAIVSFARRCARRPRIVRAAIAGASVLLVAVAASLYIQHLRDAAALAASTANADRAQAGLVEEKQQVARVLEELSWLVADIDDIDDLVREFEPGSSTTLPDGLAGSVYDLRKSVIKLRTEISHARRRAGTHAEPKPIPAPEATPPAGADQPR